MIREGSCLHFKLNTFFQRVKDPLLDVVASCFAGLVLSIQIPKSLLYEAPVSTTPTGGDAVLVSAYTRRVRRPCRSY